MKATKHIPVLMREVIEVLNPKNGEVIVDATLGGGGHTRVLLKCVLPQGRVIALDIDQDALTMLREADDTDAIIQ